MVMSLLSYSQYCTSNGNTSYQTSTTRVVFNTIDNSTGKPAAYSDYTGISTSVNAGSAYSLSIQLNTDGNYTVYSKVWIDWNQDNDFDDAGEEYDLGSATNVSNGATSNSPLSVTVPATAVAGNTRMRVSAKYGSAATSCETGYDGEVEDYTVNVISSGGIVTFYNTVASNGYTFFDNIRTDATPRFTISNSSDFNTINFEINTKADFSGTAYTQTISTTTHSANTHYDFLCDNISPALPTTNGAVYYVRARTSNDGGSTWGPWSSQLRSFTYDVSNYGWFQTAQAQFEEGSHTGNFIYNTTNGTTADYIYMNQGSFDLRSYDGGVKECSSWYPSSNVDYMTIGYQDGNCTGRIYTGTRFLNVPIPNSANILSASYTLWESDQCPSTDPNSTIYSTLEAYDTDNAPLASSSIDTYPTTSNSVSWSFYYTETANVEHTVSSGVENIVNEIVNRAGWNENNAILMMTESGSTNDNGCVWQGSHSSYQPRLTGTFTNFENYWISSAIEFPLMTCSSNYQNLVWDADQTYGSVKIQLYYDNSGTPTIIPDADLPGNSNGFTNSPVDISSLNTSTYNKLYIKAILKYTSSNPNETPKLNSWGITADPVASADAGSNQDICPASSATLTFTGCGMIQWSTGDTASSITVTPASSTTYYVTATVGDGDYEIDSVRVNIIAPISITASDTSICSGDWVYIYSSNSTAHTWEDRPINITLQGHEHDDTIYYDPPIDSSRIILTDDICNTKDTIFFTVYPNNTISLTSTANTDNQTLCINNPIIDITYSTTGATGATFSGLPSGVYGNWNNGIVTINGTPIVSGTYNYSVDLTGGCGNISATGTITVNPKPSATASSNSPVCYGEDINLTSSPDNMQTYEWTGPNSYTSIYQNPIIDSASNSKAGTYTVIVTDANGCKDTATTSVTVKTLPIHISSNSPVCEGTDIQLNETSPPPMYMISYHWDGPNGFSQNGGNQTISDATQSMEGYYVITATGNGCVRKDSLFVDILPQPDISVSATDTNICFGDTVTLYVTENGIGYVQADWSNGESGVSEITVSPNQTTAYYATYTATCTATDTLTITVNPLPNIDSLNTTEVTVCNSPYNGAIYVYPDTNMYSFDGLAFTSTNYTDTLNVGIHHITIKNIYGCTIDTSVIINSNTGISIDSVRYTPILCYGDTSVLTVYDVDAVQYSIDNGNTYTVNNQFNVIAGTYNILIKDAGNCTAMQQVQISQPDSINIQISSTDISCGNIGQASVVASGGTGNLSYLWNTNDTTSSISTINVGTYTITVSDENNCSNTASVNVIEGNLTGSLQVNVSNITCYNDNNGEISVSLNNSYSPVHYQWSNTNADTNTIVNLPAGTYSVTLTDSIGCYADTSITLNNPAQISITDSVKNISCYGYSDGYISILVENAQLPYTTHWSNNNSGDTLTNLNAGIYYLTLTDNNNCIAYDTINITQPDSLQMSYTIKNVSCYGYSDGAIDIDVSGGTSPYLFIWNGDSEAGEDLTQLQAGSYNLTVSDAHNCTINNTFTITQPDSLYNDLDISYDNYKASVEITTHGGTPDYVYQWSDNTNASTASNVKPGYYTVIVTDANLCSDTIYFNIEDNEPIIIPSVITPNGDGFNDTWNIQNVESLENIEIYIFNRWGDKVFEYRGTGVDYASASKQWNGLYNGKELPLGTYVYILKVKDSDTFKGTVTIVR